MLIRTIRYLFAALYIRPDVQLGPFKFMRYLATVATLFLVLAFIRNVLNSYFPGHDGLMWLGEIVLVAVGVLFLARFIRRDQRNQPTS